MVVVKIAAAKRLIGECERVGFHRPTIARAPHVCNLETLCLPSPPTQFAGKAAAFNSQIRYLIDNLPVSSSSSILAQRKGTMRASLVMSQMWSKPCTQSLASIVAFGESEAFTGPLHLLTTRPVIVCDLILLLWLAAGSSRQD